MGRRLNPVRNFRPCSRGSVYSACMDIVVAVADAHLTQNIAGGWTVISLAFCMA